MSSNNNSNDEDLEGADIWGDGEETKTDSPTQETASSSPVEEDDILGSDVLAMSNAELRQRTTMIENEIRMMKSELQRIRHESQGQQERIKENIEKVKVNKQLPYLVGNVVEILEPEAEDGMSFMRSWDVDVFSLFGSLFYPLYNVRYGK